MTTGTDMPNAHMPLSDLLDALNGFGVTVPNAERWKELRAAAVALSPAPLDEPGDLFAWSVPEFEAHVREQALLGLITDQGRGGDPAYLRSASRYLQPLNEAMRQTIRDNTSAIIKGLRVPFDKAAGELRNTIALGVKPDDNLQSLFEADKPVRMAWLSAQHHAKSLDQLLSVRQALSFTAKVPPVPDLDTMTVRHGGDTGTPWGTTITTNGRTLAPYDSAAPWQRWLSIAEDLYLVDPSGMTAFGELQLINPALAQTLQLHVNGAHDSSPEPEPDGRKTSPRPAVGPLTP